MSYKYLVAFQRPFKVNALPIESQVVEFDLPIADASELQALAEKLTPSSDNRLVTIINIQELPIGKPVPGLRGC